MRGSRRLGSSNLKMQSLVRGTSMYSVEELGLGYSDRVVYMLNGRGREKVNSSVGNAGHVE